MQLNTKRFASAAAITMGVVYVVCAAFVALFPAFATTLLGWLTHLVDLETRALTWGGFLGGLVQAILYTYLAGLLFGWLHNRSVQPKA